jgi:hypothetical protein
LDYPFFFQGLIEHTSSIQCYTCSELHNYCPLPLNLDGGDESNENDIDAFNYDTGYACLVGNSNNNNKRDLFDCFFLE